MSETDSADRESIASLPGEHFCDFIDETVGKFTIPIMPNAVKKNTQVMLSTISRYLRTAQHSRRQIRRQQALVPVDNR